MKTFSRGTSTMRRGGGHRHNNMFGPLVRFLRRRFIFPYRVHLLKVLYRKQQAAWRFEELMIAPCLLYALRTLVIFFVIQHQWWAYEDYDVLIGLLNHGHTYSAYLALCMMAMLLFTAYTNYYLYHAFVRGGVPKVIDYFKQVNLVNTDQIVDENAIIFRWMFKWPNWRQHPIRQSRTVANFLVALYRGDNIDKICLPGRLSDFPAMSKHNRLKVFLLYLFCEVALIFVFFMFVLLVVGIMLVLVVFNDSKVDAIYWPQIIADLTLTITVSWLLLDNAMMMMLMIWVIVYVIHLYLRQLNKLIDEMCRPKPKHAFGIALTARLRVLWREHHRICSCIENGARHWDKLMAVFLVTNLVPNVYFLTYFLNHSYQNLSHLFTIIAILFGQVVISMLTTIPAAYNSTMAHYAGAKFVPLQAKIRDLQMKLKWDNYHTLINTKQHKVAYTANVFGQITLFAMFQFIFVYGQAIIFFTGMVRKSQNRMASVHQ